MNKAKELETYLNDDGGEWILVRRDFLTFIASALDESMDEGLILGEETKEEDFTKWSDAKVDRADTAYGLIDALIGRMK